MRATGVLQGVSPDPDPFPREGDAAPLGHTEFAGLMARLAPFEIRPLLAVGVSGGADSLALLLLADSWARDRRGEAVALTIDHGLRAEGAAEARAVAAFCRSRGIAHETLTLDHRLPRRNLEAGARAARYARLAEWCRARGCLHLLTAHHQEDQAETFLLRLARGSGVDGLAGMAPVRELAECRVLRPLLEVPRARLWALLASQGIAPIADDTMNRDDRFARPRLRRAEAVLAAEGLGTERLSRTAARLGEARAALEQAAADLLARAVSLEPAGYAWVDRSLLLSAPRDTGLRALSRLVATISGAEYPPRYERLVAAYDGLAGVAVGRTIGGCRLIAKGDRVLVCREAAATAPPLAVQPGARLRWDGRFVVALAAAAPAGLTVGALGREPIPGDRHHAVPLAVRAALPTLRRGGTLVAVPPLGYFAAGWRSKSPIGAFFFQPARPLASAGFTVV
jgi:tRNA(Ile)-lysidine synthase